MKKTLTLLLLVAATTAGAQTDSLSLFKKYELETIYLSSRGYIKNNQSFKLRKLSNEFNFTPQGLALYQGYRSDNRKFMVTYAVGVGLLIGGLVVSSSDRTTSNILLGTSLVPIAFSLHFVIRSQNKLTRAIWIRNRDALLTK